MESINSFEYRLYFGNDIKDPTKMVVEIPALHAKQYVYAKIGEFDYSLVLTGLKFTRQVYQPGLIEAEVTIRPIREIIDNKSTNTTRLPTFEEVQNVFMNRQVELTIVNKPNKEAKAIDNETTIAKNYYVHMMNPQIAYNQGNMEIYLKLTIYSLDKLMDIDKYCKAFTGKKLASEILKKESAGFGIPDSAMLINIENLQHLKYNTKEEMIQPYLVQYNESFYNFMVRTANRCGEFLFFENGKMTIGLPKTEEEELNTFYTITMQDYTNGPVDNVEDYSRDWAKDDGNIKGDLNYDAIDVDDAGYPTDTFPAKPQYNIPQSGGEYIFPLDNDKYNNLKRELCLRTGGGEVLKTLLLRATSAVAGYEGGNVLKMVANNATKLAIDSANAASVMGWSDRDLKNKIDESWKDKKEHYNGQKLVVFSSLDSKGWISNKFYADIRKKEDELHKKMICIDMATNYVPVKVGDRIKVKDLTGSYIVVRIHQVADLAWQHNYKTFDPSDPTTDIYSNRQSQMIWAIPVGSQKINDTTTSEMVMPPVAPVPMICKSGPQTAFVIDSDEKKYQGCVRIAYPWQSPNDAKRRDLNLANEELKNMKKESEKWVEQRDELLTFLTLLKNKIKDEVEKLVAKSKEELDQLYKEWKERLIVIENEMKKLDLTLPADPIMEMDEDASVEIDKDTYTAYAKEFKENRDKYEKYRKEKEEKELLLKYIDDSGKDPKEAVKLVDKDCEEAKTKINDLDNNIKKLESSIKNQEGVVEKKEEEWNKEVKKAATPWVRVATPLATKGGGAFFKPKKGDEVLVNFDSDNIERPYVVGSVYSKNNLAPGEGLDRFAKNYLQKKAQIALMSSNGQHISFAAPSDGWKFVQSFSPALKTLQFYFPALKGEDVLKSDIKDLCGGIYMGDRFGMYELSLSSHDRKIKINSPYGDVEIGAFTGINIKAPNGDIKISGKNVTIEAGNKLTIHSGKNIIDDKDWGTKFKASLKEGLWENQIYKTFFSNFVELKVVDLALVRNIIDVFLRPIDGTLFLKSNNYVMLEAGKGKAQVPLDRYSPKYQKHYTYLDELVFRRVYCKMTEYIKRMDSKLSQFEKKYYKLKRAAYQKKAAFDKALSKCWANPQDKPNIIGTVYNIEDFVKNDILFQGGTLEDLIGGIEAEHLLGQGPWNVKGHGKVANLDAFKAAVQPIFEAYGSAIVDLHKHVLSITNLFGAGGNEEVIKVNQFLLDEQPAQAPAQAPAQVPIQQEQPQQGQPQQEQPQAQANQPQDDNTAWIDAEFKSIVTSELTLTTFLNSWKQRFGDDAPSEHFMNDGVEDQNDPFKKMLILKRTMIATFLSHLYNRDENKENNQAGKYFHLSYTANDINEELVTKHWGNVASLTPIPPVVAAQPQSLLAKAWKATSSSIAAGAVWYFKKFMTGSSYKPVADLKAPGCGWAHQVWNDKSGQILMSNEKGITYAVEKGSLKKLDVTTWSNLNSVKDAIKAVK